MVSVRPSHKFRQNLPRVTTTFTSMSFLIMSQDSGLDIHVFVYQTNYVAFFKSENKYLINEA